MNDTYDTLHEDEDHEITMHDDGMSDTYEPRGMKTALNKRSQWGAFKLCTA